MKKIVVIILLFVSAAAFTQQKSELTSESTTVITKTGKPAGKKTESKINKDGGSLRSSDGMVELIVPTGAVSKKVIISIQPITNALPNGTGMAYRFEPSGIIFNKAIHAIFHYADEEVNKISLLGIAMQDDKGQWFSLNKSEVDTVAKTISGDLMHFSDWGKFEAVKLYPTYARLKVSKQMLLTIDLVSSEEDDLITSLRNTDDVNLLSPLKKRNIPWTSTWKANEITNGNATVGRIDVQSKVVINYTAPSTPPPKNPVEISVNLNGLTFSYKKETLRDLRLVSNILIYDNAYEISMISEIVDQGAGTNLGAVTYRDTGSFVVSINGNESRLIERINRNISASLEYTGGCCSNYKILKSGTGNIHIAGNPVIKVTPASGTQRNAIVEISFRKLPSIFPIFQVTCFCPGDKSPMTQTNSRGVMMMASILPTYPQYIKFETKEGEQIIHEEGKPGDPIYTKVIVKQLKED